MIFLCNPLEIYRHRELFNIFLHHIVSNYFLLVKKKKNSDFSIVESKEGQDIIARYEKLLKILSDKEIELFEEWILLVPSIVEKGLKRTLLTRDRGSILLMVNFDPELLAILKEVSFLKQTAHTNIPRLALEVSEQAETFRKYRTLLNITVTAYNDIRRTSQQVEYNLIELEVARIDSLVTRGERELCWKSEGLPDYSNELGELVQSLWKRLKAIQANVEKIQQILEPWTKTPLIERKDARKDTLLSLDDRAENVTKRYSDMEIAAEQIHGLLKENEVLFEISSENNDSWREYVTYVDDIVTESLRKALGCCLSYLSENMDPTTQSESLLEAKLELREPDLYYEPSLDSDDSDGLEQLVIGILNDIMNMVTLFPRLKSDAIGYGPELEQDDDIKAMKNEILSGVIKAIDEATEFCGIFEGNKTI